MDRALGTILMGSQPIIMGRVERVMAYVSMQFQMAHSKIYIHTNDGVGLNVAGPGSTGNRFENIYASNNMSVGITNNASNNVWRKLQLGNNHWGSLQIQGGSNSTYTEIVIANSRTGGSAMTVSGAQNTIGFVTLANGGSQTLRTFAGAVNSTIFQTIVVNSASSAIDVDSDNIRFSQIGAFHSTQGVNLNCSSCEFHDNLLMGNNGDDCTITGGVLPGVDTNCVNDAQSSAVYNTGKDMTQAFVFSGTKYAKVTTTDATNGSNTNGTETFGVITNWTTFANRYRTWGMDGGDFPVGGNRGRCEAGTCRIWDWTLNNLDNQIYNRSNDGVNPNALFVNGNPCPAAVHGNKSLIDQQAAPQTFLINAVEIDNDGFGDDDGLCENNDHCIYAPNFGAYQGEGAYVGNTCTFTNGNVTGVTMYNYTTNGI